MLKRSGGREREEGQGELHKSRRGAINIRLPSAGFSQGTII